MAVTPLSISELDTTGVLEAMAAFNADGHTILNTGREWVRIDNGSAGERTFTIATPETRGGADLAVADEVVTIAAGAAKVIGGWLPLTLYNDSNNLVTITVDAEASVTIQGFRLP